jgi:hypothetical protein
MVALGSAVLAWTGPDTLTTRNYEQIVLQLTDHARALAADVRRRAERWHHHPVQFRR